MPTNEEIDEYETCFAAYPDIREEYNNILVKVSKPTLAAAYEPDDTISVYAIIATLPSAKYKRFDYSHGPLANRKYFELRYYRKHINLLSSSPAEIMLNHGMVTILKSRKK